MIKTILGASFVAANFAVAAQAQAQGVISCSERYKAVKHLEEKYGESVVVSGLSESGVVEVWGNEDTGTWTITITRPNQIMCAMSFGDFLFVYPSGDPA